MGSCPVSARAELKTSVQMGSQFRPICFLIHLSHLQSRSITKRTQKTNKTKNEWFHVVQHAQDLLKFPPGYRWQFGPELLNLTLHREPPTSTIKTPNIPLRLYYIVF